MMWLHLVARPLLGLLDGLLRAIPLWFVAVAAGGLLVAYSLGYDPIGAAWSWLLDALAGAVRDEIGV